MAIAAGDRLPEATLLRMGAEGPEEVPLGDIVNGRKVVLFGLPGAFTRTCTAAHLPSFIRTREAFVAKGVDEIVCVAVNDPFVMAAWGAATGASDAGITMLGDASGGFIRGIGMDFTAPPAGFFGRSKRFALLAEDGVVKVLHTEAGPGICEATAGEALLAAI